MITLEEEYKVQTKLISIWSTLLSVLAARTNCKKKKEVESDHHMCCKRALQVKERKKERNYLKSLTNFSPPQLAPSPFGKPVDFFFMCMNIWSLTNCILSGCILLCSKLLKRDHSEG
jgi:hypothetical protein